MDFSNDDILEFGGGQSTLWWAHRSRSVLTVEEDVEWANYVERALTACPHVRIIAEPDLDRHAAAPLGSKFDVVIIDGGDRMKCAETALRVVHDDGLIILDDSQGHWGPEPTYPILDLFDRNDFMRVDFYGYSSVGMRPGCTSFFMRADTQRLRHLPPPVQKSF